MIADAAASTRQASAASRRGQRSSNVSSAVSEAGTPRRYESAWGVGTGCGRTSPLWTADLTGQAVAAAGVVEDDEDEAAESEGDDEDEAAESEDEDAEDDDEDFADEPLRLSVR